MRLLLLGTALLAACGGGESAEPVPERTFVATCPGLAPDTTYGHRLVGQAVVVNFSTTVAQFGDNCNIREVRP